MFQVAELTIVDTAKVGNLILNPRQVRILETECRQTGVYYTHLPTLVCNYYFHWLRKPWYSFELHDIQWSVSITVLCVEPYLWGLFMNISYYMIIVNNPVIRRLQRTLISNWIKNNTGILVQSSDLLTKKRPLGICFPLKSERLALICE